MHHLLKAYLYSHHAAHILSGSVCWCKFINKGGGGGTLGVSSPVKDNHAMGKWYPPISELAN